MGKKPPSDEVSIGKFDILATYAYARALLDGSPVGEAKERGMVAAVMGAKARLGHSCDTGRRSPLTATAPGVWSRAHSAAKRYPTPCSVWMYRDVAGSSPSLRRRPATNTRR